MPRIRYASFLRVIVILGLFCIWLQIMLSASSGGLERDGEELMNANETSEQVLALVPQELHKYLTVHPRNNSANSTDLPKNITEIRRSIKRYNDAQTIYNEDIFGPVQNDTIIIAVQADRNVYQGRCIHWLSDTLGLLGSFFLLQNFSLVGIKEYKDYEGPDEGHGNAGDPTTVHTRLTYLRHLIVSLAQARDIERTLLVFSHDYYDEEINNLVRTIDFTKVMQIFYPYSIQTHPNEFPGVDPNDCPRDAKFEQAIKLKCNNALHPDSHGHYREAKYTQTKHHWWWKANRIFNQLQCTATHTGMVVFLEEDHYVAEDFLHVLNLMRTTADKSCPQCEILCLGTYLKTYQYHATGDKRKKQLTLSYIQQVRAANEERRRRKMDTSSWNYQVYPNLYGYTQKVEITPWHSSIHNMGMAFNRTLWNNIMSLQDQFCAYDDYNWDYSLLHLAQNRQGREKMKVMLCKGPRVFHIGECGLHHKKSNCNANLVISKVQKLLQTTKHLLYPKRLTASINPGGAKHNKRLVKGNGGWGDIRDQELCANMTKVGRQARKYVYFA